MINIYFKKLEKNAIVPDMAYDDTQAGFDFYSIEEKVIPAKSKEIIRTGLAWEPKWTSGPFSNFTDLFKIYLKLFSRSGLSAKNSLEVGAGVIDSDYRGEIKIIIHNFGNENHLIKKGAKIAQGIVYLIPHINIDEKEELSDTNRGEKGFGSSGG